MFAIIVNDIVKLKRTLVLMVCVAAPLCAGAFPVMVMLNHPDAKPWIQMLGEGAAVWAYFLFPMAVTALTVLVAQIEHGPRMWNHLLALPVDRGKLFAAKLVVVAGLCVLMTVILYVVLYAAVIAGAAFIPGATVTGDPQWADTFVSLLMMTGAGLCMIVIQLWVALRFRSFAVPLVLGIVGTFFALAIQAAKAAVFLPWLAPAYTFTVTRPGSLAVVIFGYAGGLVLIPLMLWHLSRYERTN
ncbi:MAG: ABC transporter permease [Asticcacaulis sp.]